MEDEYYGVDMDNSEDDEVEEGQESAKKKYKDLLKEKTEKSIKPFTVRVKIPVKKS